MVISSMLYLVIISIIFIISCILSTEKYLYIYTLSSKQRLIMPYKFIFPQKAYLFLFTTLFFLTAFRSSLVGNDTFHYMQIFKFIVMNNANLATHYEMGFRLFCMFIAKISINPQAIIICSSVIVYIMIWFYYKKFSFMPLFALTLFWCFSFSHFTNVIRHAMAAVCLLYAYSYSVNKKWIKSFLIICISISFHTSALLFLPYYFIILLNIKCRTFYWLLLFWSLVLSLFFNEMIIDILICFIYQVDPYYVRYLIGDRVASGRLGILSYLAIVGLLFIITKFFYGKLKMKNNEIWLFYFSFLFFILGFSMNLFDRVANYYLLLLIVPVTNQIVLRFRGLCIQKILINIFFTTNILLFLLRVILRPEWNRLYPYSSF